MQPCAKLLMHSIAFLSPGESLADEALIFQVKLNTGLGGGEGSATKVHSQSQEARGTKCKLLV